MMSGKYIYTCFLLFLFQAAGSKATLVCNKCNNSESLDTCQDVIQCGNEQSCFTEIQTKDEQITYTMGCTDNQNCGEIPENVSVSMLNSLPIKKCYECCESKGCNYHLCNNPKPTLVCNKCNSSDSLDKCQDVIQCGDEQSCFTEIQTKDEQITYTMGCTDNQNCGDIPENVSVSMLNSLPIKKCYECCESEGCNYHLCNNPKPTLVCNKCNSSDSLDKCKDVIQCEEGQSCFTEIQTKDEHIIYTMGCTDNQNCGEIPEYVSVSKLNSPSIKKCYKCCKSKGCNYHLCNQTEPSTSQDDKRMDCAKLNEMFDTCEDIHDAKLVCPKLCTLCRLVDGNWADWSQWSACDVTCGNGKHTRIRSCTNPAPKYQGLECEGEKIDSKVCQRPLCPVHGGWSSWSNWTACPVTCGIGMQKRHRNCSNPYPLRYGDHCFGDPLEFKNCFEKLCDGGVWGSWEEWGACSASCDSGIRKRSRSCANLVGTICSGNSLDVQLCNIHECPCRTLPTLRNGVLKLQSESSSNITYNIICNDGYQVSGQNYSICDKKSGWNDNSNCDTVVSCGKPVTPSNGRLVFASGITFNSIAKFECLSSFSAYGNPISTCLRDGTWSKIVTCISPVSTCAKKTSYITSFSNVALGKHATLSTAKSYSKSTSMTDRNYDTYVHTLLDLNPFAIIDLGQEYDIVAFYVVNRKDCCVDRLRDVVIQIGAELSSLTTVVRQRGRMGTKCMFELVKPIRGRFVKLMMEAKEYLHIAELEVYSKRNN